MKILFSLMLLCSATILGGGCMTTDDTCSGDRCVCSGNDDCGHTCANGAAECHIQGGSGPVDVTCQNNGSCHVECTAASSCEVECGGSSDCHVTCPPSGCTVTGCVGAACVVACGLGTAASRSGTTATCP